MGANGGPIMRQPRPAERTDGRIVKVDPQTGRTVRVYPMPDGGGVHGVLYADGSLWMTCFQWNVIARVHPDAGGSAELARRVNLARDTLVAELNCRTPRAS